MNFFRRFPSYNHLAAEAGAVLRRFPFVLASAAAASASAVYLVHVDEAAESSPVFRILLCGLLGLPLFFAVATLAERHPGRRGLWTLLTAGGLVLLAGYYLSLPAVLDRPDAPLLRFFLLALGLHFLVAFLPFARRGEVDGFWQFNRILFLRFLVAALYSGVLFAGLAIAMAAIDNLFGVQIDGKLYAQLFMVIAGLFHTWFFLAGVPTDLEALNRATDYPTGLKVFTQYILLPLVVLYFVILITYEAKILATWNWPRGWASQLVLWFSVVGILSLLLLFPLEKRAESRWIVAFGRWFFRGLIPLVAMLFLAIYQRIGEYGITVNRFLVVGMAVGLSVLVLYFVFGRQRDIRAIPIVLCALAFLSTYGPQSAFSVARDSQRHRLEALMQKHGILADGRARPTAATIPWEDRRQMSSVVAYLCDWHGPDAYAGWFPDSVRAAWQDSGRAGAWREEVTLAMGFKYYPQWRGSGEGNYFSFSSAQTGTSALPISDFDYLIDVSSRVGRDSTMACRMGQDSCFTRIDRDPARLWIGIGQSRDACDDSLGVALSPPIMALIEAGMPRELEPESLVIDASGTGFQTRLQIQSVSGQWDSETIKLDAMRGRVLVSRRPQAAATD